MADAERGNRDEPQRWPDVWGIRKITLEKVKKKRKEKFVTGILRQNRRYQVKWKSRDGESYEHEAAR